MKKKVWRESGLEERIGLDPRWETTDGKESILFGNWVGWKGTPIEFQYEGEGKRRGGRPQNVKSPSLSGYRQKGD